jgi:hypothetical protein
MLSFGPLATYPISVPPMPPLEPAPSPVYFADRAWTTEPDETELPNQLWSPRLAAFNLERTLPLSPFDDRRALMQAGEIALLNTDEGLDRLIGLPIDGRKIAVMIGAPGFRLDEFQTIFTGIGSNWRSAADGMLYCTPRDLTWELEAPAQTNLFAGTGGLEGTAELAHRPKPLWYGVRRDWPLTMIDETRLILQAHDGTMKEISDVSDKGAPLTYAGDVEDIEEAPQPEAGTYITELRRGYVRIGSAPIGVVTATGKGDCTNGIYVDKIADIIFRLLHDRAHWPDARFNMQKFRKYKLLQPGAVGIATTIEVKTFADLIDELTATDDAWYEVSPLGIFGLGRLDKPSDTPVAYFDDRHIRQVTAIDPPDSISPAFWNVKVGAQQCGWDFRGEYATGISAERRQFLSQKYRYPEPSIAGDVRARHPQAKTVELPSLFDSLDDAQYRQDRLLTVNDDRPRLAKVDFWGHVYGIALGDTVHITHRGKELDAGRRCVVFGWGARTQTHQTYLLVRYWP